MGKDDVVRAAADAVVAGGSITIAVGIWFQWFQIASAIIIGIGTILLLALRILGAWYALKHKRNEE